MRADQRGGTIRFALFLWAVVAARAQQAGVTQAGERFVVDTNVACHVDPNLASATADRVPPGLLPSIEPDPGKTVKRNT